MANFELQTRVPLMIRAPWLAGSKVRAARYCCCSPLPRLLLPPLRLLMLHLLLMLLLMLLLTAAPPASPPGLNVCQGEGTFICCGALWTPRYHLPYHVTVL